MLLVGSRLQRFFECAHRYVVADINVAAHDLANGGEQLFLWSFFHHETVCAGTERALGEDGLLESGINEDQQIRALRLERFKEFETVASTQPQCSEQHLRFAFLELVARVTNAV